LSHSDYRRIIVHHFKFLTMDKELLDALYNKAQEIAKETANKLMQYHRSVAEVYYGSNPLSINADDLNGEDQAEARAVAEKYNQYQEDAIAKADYAPADKVRQANEMEEIIKEGNTRIKKLYEDAINDQNKPL
jgi:hypothetical protein